MKVRLNPNAAEFSPSPSPSHSYDDLHKAGTTRAAAGRPSVDSGASSQTPRERPADQLPADPFGEAISEQVSLQRRQSLDDLIDHYKLPDDPFEMGPSEQAVAPKSEPAQGRPDLAPGTSRHATSKVLLVIRKKPGKAAPGPQS